MDGFLEGEINHRVAKCEWFYEVRFIARSGTPPSVNSVMTSQRPKLTFPIFVRRVKAVII